MFYLLIIGWWRLFSLIVCLGAALLTVVFHLFRTRQLLEVRNRHTRELLIATSSLRRSIAMNLHDSVGQQLVLLKQHLQDKESAPEETSELVDRVIADVREISREAYNSLLDHLGLGTALQNLLDKLDRKTDLFVYADIEDAGLVLDEVTTQYLFAIAQEGLQNVLKHSGATAVQFTFWENDRELYFCLADNGVGIGKGVSPLREGLGVYTMRERARLIGACFSLRDGKNGGTVLEIRKNLIT